jgi:hypothetical protein
MRPGTWGRYAALQTELKECENEQESKGGGYATRIIADYCELLKWIVFLAVVVVVIVIL